MQSRKFHPTKLTEQRHIALRTDQFSAICEQSNRKANKRVQFSVAGGLGILDTTSISHFAALYPRERNNMSTPVDVIVGAGSGMGAAVARAIRSKHRLLLVDRDEASVRRIAEELDADYFVCDLADSNSIAELAASIDRVGSLVGAAGVSGPPGETTLTINLLGYARLLNALDSAICEGSAINLFASMVELAPMPPEMNEVLRNPLAENFFEKIRALGMDPTDSGTGYVLSKVGIVLMVRSRAFQYWQRGARITSISPGVIDTPLLALTKDTPVVQQMKKVVQRFGDPTEVAKVAAFLVSEGSSYITGINVNVDGGYQTFVAENPDIQEALERTREETQQAMRDQG